MQTVIEQNEIETIQSMVDIFPCEDYIFYIEYLRKVIKDVKPQHYLFVGYLIGYSVSTDETLHAILNQQNQN